MENNSLPRRGISKYKLVLYRIHGCTACHITQTIVTKLLKEEFPEINLYLFNVEYDDIKLDKIRDLHLDDYPTLIMYKITLDKDIEMWRLVGTYPKDYIKTYINNVLNS